jgi:hypothetical protein
MHVNSPSRRETQTPRSTANAHVALSTTVKITAIRRNPVEGLYILENAIICFSS